MGGPGKKEHNGKPIPVDLGTVGEIVNGEFVEKSYTRKKSLGYEG
ncbi:hypothetical protein PRLR5107_00600 [Prevotella lacticifex]|uniref:Uncharacterized protein n=1 Tax=Prevotella lacticifex TaxID=2854755 RepID=A0A9R1CBN1_9BACT|nr:hypothetical protein PRLR5003_18440 [Prevotella lacticifex]GJG38546.1 hypothetical protein PRLR5019_05170 [Prevotella lacticifex]GJG42771.1 hypothetical protein PRLR5025_15570 [Prevotella lacticifex]GJG44903.1 hypothetical protein PRLR5027_04980 [Prevotella lacticifex]GJG49122.1 hypothetical protein PRLR5052_15350 [Prevotella lacticifex]